MKKISLLIADDHKLIRETWACILNAHPRFEVIAEVGDSEQVVTLALELMPDIVLMDINMGPQNGFEATKKILDVNQEVKIVGVSMHSQPLYAKKMLQLGAKGYVTKNSSQEEMFRALNEVWDGNKYLCEEVKSIISDKMLYGNENKEPTINSLSERELQIVHHIQAGHSSREIATLLEISMKTVEVHRYNIFKKLKIKKTTSLIQFVNNSPNYL